MTTTSLGSAPPRPADLERLLATIRARAAVSRRTTIVLSTPSEGRWRPS